MGYRLGLRSLNNLRGVHPDLVRVVKRAIQLTEVDFTVIEGLRSAARQRELHRKGATRTLRSRHITGHAVDIAPYVDGKIRWDWPLFLPLAEAMKAASEELDVPVRWGGNWKVLSETPEISMEVLSRSFPDGPHYELWSGKYPA